MWYSVRNSLITVTFTLLAFFVFTKIFGPVPLTINSINTNKESLFTVSATSEVTTVPDTAQMSFGVTKNSSTVETGKDQVNKIINQLTNDLKGLGISEKDIKTTNFSINPDYDYTNGRQTPKGFSINATIDVKAKSIEIANRAVDVATRDGATQVGGLQFVLTDTDKEKFEDQARKEAILKAKQKASSIANSAGIKLGRVVDVQETSGENPRPYYGLAADTLEKQTEPTQLNPGENKVVSTVTLYYETY